MIKKLMIALCVTAVFLLFITPVSADDRIVGTWQGSQSYWFIASGSGSVTFYSDGIASATGSVTIFGENIPFYADDLQWQNNGNNRYTGRTYDRHIDFKLNNDGTITAIVNPYKLGVTDFFLLNVDIPIKLHRA